MIYFSSVPISSVSEFEAVISQAVISIEKEIVHKGENPRLKDAKRDLEKLEGIARDTPAAKAFRERLAEIGETLRTEMGRADALHNDMWDLLDFIDYRM